MEKKQTAVQWLIEQFENQGFFYDLDIEAAKRMEREQLADFYINGMHKGQEIYFNEPNIKLDVNSLDYCIEQSEKCYTQTFNQ